MGEWIVVVGVILIGLLFSAYFSGAETGLYCVNRLRVFLGVQEGDVRAKRLARLIEDEQGALSITLIGTNLMNYACTTAVAYLFGSLLGKNDAEVQLYTVILVTPVVFVFGEVVPKNLFQIHADTLMPRFGYVLTAAGWAFRKVGIVGLMNRLSLLAARLFGTPTVPRRFATPKHRVAALLQEALAGHASGEEQSELIDRVVRISEMPVRSVMIGYHRVTMIAAEADRADLERLARTTDYARVLVHGPRRSQVVGLIKIDELLRQDHWKSVGELATPVIELRPGDTVAAAIARMQRSRKEMAIVTGLGGGLLGVVTLRDLLEEIAGEVVSVQAA